VGRLGLSQKSVSLLLTDDDEYASQMAQKLGEDNAERQKIEKEILGKINIHIAENPSLVQDKVIILDGEDWHHGVIGIVSSRVKDIYGKPCIVLSNNNDVCKGSGRSIEGFDLWEAVSACGDLLVQYGGHPMAVGLSLKPENVDAFRKAINDFANTKEHMPFDKLKIDCKLNPAYIDVELAKQLKYLQPYGAGNPTPVFALSNLKIANIIPLSGDKHLKLQLTNGNSHISAMKFSCSSTQFPYRVGDVVDLAVNLDVNIYKNTESLSVIIKDIKFSNVDNTMYLESLRLYESFCKGESLSKKDLSTIIPTREDFALVYRFLKQNSGFYCPIEILAHRLNDKLSYGKIKVIFEAMNELGLVAIYEDMKKFEVKLMEVRGKVDLESSTIIKQLKVVYQNEQI
jgi:single-stranded-DNA-specific exonuclease